MVGHGELDDDVDNLMQQMQDVGAGQISTGGE
jgi:hypothetical protein